MPGYLLDTSVLIALVDPNHVFHATATSTINAMSTADLQFVSAVSIGEISTGVASVQRVHGRTPIHATQVLAAAQARSLLSINTLRAERPARDLMDVPAGQLRGVATDIAHRH